jgi:hypothetical protein
MCGVYYIMTIGDVRPGGPPQTIPTNNVHAKGAKALVDLLHLPAETKATAALILKPLSDCVKSKISMAQTTLNQRVSLHVVCFVHWLTMAYTLQHAVQHRLPVAGRCSTAHVAQAVYQRPGQT